MYDLSWLNPTPHAIAVYASQPLSPVTTQHSLPSGRYSLLGPDLHRLDRTSFAWRTYSITSSARGPRAIPAASSHSIALLDLYRSVVDRRQHLRRIAGDDNVDHRRAVEFFHSSPQRAGQRFGILNADAAAAHRAGDRGVIHLDKVGRLIAAAHHRVLQRFDVTRRGVVDDNHREPEPGAARGFQLAEHHIEPAIARNCDDGPVRRGKARPHPARQ